jgi:hypothetical protein
VQKTVGVAESFEVLLSNRLVVQCSVWVRLINISDFSQLFVCVSNIVPLKGKFTTYIFISCTVSTIHPLPDNNHAIFPGIRLAHN